MNNEEKINERAAELARWIEEMADAPREQALLARRLFDGLATRLLEGAPGATHISAPNLVAEVVDKDSGRLYRRYLEVEYDESDNGLRLLGEDIGANPVQIVFLSEKALSRMHDLQGQGPDSPRCHD